MLPNQRRNPRHLDCLKCVDTHVDVPPHTFFKIEFRKHWIHNSRLLMTSYAKINWSRGYKYYGQVKDGVACGDGHVEMTSTTHVDGLGSAKLVKFSGKFDNLAVTDVIFEFERQGVAYEFTGTTNELCLVSGKLVCKTGTGWTFTGTFDHAKLVTGILEHPMFENSASVTSIGITYDRLLHMTSCAQLLLDVANGAVIAAKNSTYTIPSNVVRSDATCIYDGEYAIVNNKIVDNGNGKKIYTKSGIVAEGKFVFDEFVRGTLTVAGAKIPISGKTELGGEYTISSDLFK